MRSQRCGRPGHHGMALSFGLLLSVLGGAQEPTPVPKPSLDLLCGQLLRGEKAWDQLGADERSGVFGWLSRRARDPAQPKDIVLLSQLLRLHAQIPGDGQWLLERLDDPSWVGPETTPLILQALANDLRTAGGGRLQWTAHAIGGHRQWARPLLLDACERLLREKDLDCVDSLLPLIVEIGPDSPVVSVCLREYLSRKEQNLYILALNLIRELTTENKKRLHTVLIGMLLANPALDLDTACYIEGCLHTCELSDEELLMLVREARDIGPVYYGLRRLAEKDAIPKELAEAAAEAVRRAGDDRQIQELGVQIAKKAAAGALKKDR